MLRKSILACAISLVTTGALAGDNHKTGKHSFNFQPLTESADAAEWDPASPWKLPKGFKQSVVSDESDLNIYDGGRDDWHDMNVVNETGPEAGRYLYRTHELRLPGSLPEGGSLSVVDLKTGTTTLLAQDPTWDALDGIRWTPWGTLLFAEEVTGGRLFEVYLNDDMTTVASVEDRPAVGRLAHEGIDLDVDGNIYVVDEFRGRTDTGGDNTCGGTSPCGGGIYKFVPDVAGDLTSGRLYVLGFPNAVGDRRDNTGRAEWLGPIDALDARNSGTQMGGASYQRPEDLEIIGDTLYVAITEGPLDEYGKEYYEGRVLAVNLETMVVTDFVKAGVNVPVEIAKPGETGHQSGFDSVDNLAESPDGRLIMIEDNTPSDIWLASTKTDQFGYAKDVDLFASLTDPGAEGTGIYFSPTDPDTFYVNVQHSQADDGDATWAISRQSGKKKYPGKKK